MSLDGHGLQEGRRCRGNTRRRPGGRCDVLMSQGVIAVIQAMPVLRWYSVEIVRRLAGCDTCRRRLPVETGGPFFR